MIFSIINFWFIKLRIHCLRVHKCFKLSFIYETKVNEACKSIRYRGLCNLEKIDAKLRTKVRYIFFVFIFMVSIRLEIFSALFCSLMSKGIYFRIYTKFTCCNIRNLVIVLIVMVTSLVVVLKYIYI